MMRLNRPTIAAVAITIALMGSVSADVISSARPPSLPGLAPPPSLTPPLPEGGDPLGLTGAAAALNRENSPLLREAERGALAGSSLADHPIPSAAPFPLARPELPRETLLGASTREAVRDRSVRNLERGSDPFSGHNIRIPEPASLTLLFAGLIGLVARNRLRRDHHPKKIVPVNPDVVAPG
ncbi:MAG: hypothetical protein JWN86_4236 [Planctomycetota bacterium]|nr:hypothetical protein [Planctomycetota bacterium]